MITIKQEKDETVTIEGLNESDLLTLYMISQTCFWQVKVKKELVEEAYNLGRLIEDFYHKKNGSKLKYLP